MIQPQRREFIRKKDIKPQNNTLEGLFTQIQQLSKNLANPQDREKYLDLKERHYRAFLNKINKSNNHNVAFPIASFAPYKYFFGKGNNSQAVRACFKQRFWWSMGDFDDYADYNFTWTQWKNNRIIEGLKTHKELLAEDNKKDEKQEHSLASTHVTDKESGSSTENLITTPKRKLTTQNTIGSASAKECPAKPEEKQPQQNSTQKPKKELKPFTSGIAPLRRYDKETAHVDPSAENHTSHGLRTTNH